MSLMTHARDSAPLVTGPRSFDGICRKQDRLLVVANLCSFALCQKCTVIPQAFAPRTRQRLPVLHDDATPHRPAGVGLLLLPGTRCPEAAVAGERCYGAW